MFLDSGEVKASRFNGGKERLTLIDPTFIRGMAQVMMIGADKYGDTNWLKGMDAVVILDSLMRHTQKIALGEEIDEESGFHHAYHIGCNAMLLARMMQDPKYRDHKSVLFEDFNTKEK